MGVTALPSSLPSRGAAAARRACASRLRLDPTCIPSSVVAAAKKPKRIGSCGEDGPPTKRRRPEQDGGAAAAQAMSLEEKNGVNRLLLSLRPPGCSPDKVLPLPDAVVRVLQENQTGCGGREDEIEIDVYALADGALRAIKDRVGAYLEERARREDAPSQSKDGAIKQSPSRSVPPRAPPTSIPPRAPPTSIPPRATPTSIPPRTTTTSIPPRAAPTTISARPVPTTIQPRPAPKSFPPRAVPSLPAPPKSSGSRESTSELLETAINQSPPSSTPPRAAPSLPAPPKPAAGSTKSMRELLADAAEVMKRVVRRRELEKLRAAARLELAQIVRTVEFNDPYIDPQDAFK